MSLSLFTGDDWDIVVTLKKDGVAYDVSTATAIQAAVVSDDGTAPTTIVSAVTLDSGATGANWAKGVVIVEIPAATTASLTSQRAFVEIQVTIGGKKSTWPRQAVDVKVGTIA